MRRHPVSLVLVEPRAYAAPWWRLRVSGSRTVVLRKLSQQISEDVCAGLLSARLRLSAAYERIEDASGVEHGSGFLLNSQGPPHDKLCLLRCQRNLRTVEETM
jgi:hypothetical protein